MVYGVVVSGNLTLSLKFCPQILSSPSPSSSSQLSQLGASLYAPQSKFFISAITLQLRQSSIGVT